MFSCCLIPFIFGETQPSLHCRHNQPSHRQTFSGPNLAAESGCRTYCSTAALQSLLHNVRVPQFIHLCKLTHRVANRKQVHDLQILESTNSTNTNKQKPVEAQPSPILIVQVLFWIPNHDKFITGFEHSSILLILFHCTSHV